MAAIPNNETVWLVAAPKLLAHSVDRDGRHYKREADHALCLERHLMPLRGDDDEMRDDAADHDQEKSPANAPAENVQ